MTDKPHSVFAYPGNKASLTPWILEHVPADHRTYVEVFGGAAGVLANKPASFNEVYNDVDGDLVQFFDTLRELGDELAEWLSRVPYAREKYDEWSGQWYEGWRPEDPVERAGVFWFLRQVSFNGKYYTPGGFAVSTKRNQARTYANQIDRLEAFADRFREVVVEHLDWRECIGQWDSPETVFYADPPYPEKEFRYPNGPGFDHHAFVDELRALEGRWIVSYEDPGTDDRHDALEGLLETATVVATREMTYRMASGYNGPSESSTELLAMNFDPRDCDPFVDRQQRLTEVAATDGGTDR